jgi:hypothetical protein
MSMSSFPVGRTHSEHCHLKPLGVRYIPGPTVLIADDRHDKLLSDVD